MASIFAPTLHSELPYSPATGSTLPPCLRRPTLRRALSSSGNIIDCQLTGLPRTLCPKDADAFSFDPEFLDAWTMPDDLWTYLPRPILAHLAAMQHAGAAVLTGFDRLERQRLALKSEIISTAACDEGDHILNDSSFRMALAIPECPIVGPGLSLDVLFANMKMEASMYRARVDSIMTMDSATTSCSSSRSSMSTSGVSTPGICTPATPITPTTPVTPLGSPRVSTSKQRSGPFAPLSDAAASREDFFFNCDHDSPPPAAVTHEFSTPLDPPEAYYEAELRELRRSAIVRLRHAARRVETEWSECKRYADVDGWARDSFEHWWAKKRTSSAELEQKLKEYERPA
ncbi:hypothetical protein K490DRAFT_66759 [Saccharata proteae CBS 121410]|uniref:Uncharacterized protein n=1 Tax=Saccharata proteae CBS 121410 TaxID=1314787 RepID=A0A9P4LXY7_9PEZI|nr:hypothetical protein K490DRAFT_66759 [Saccharata proteae CBS 121410]